MWCKRRRYPIGAGLFALLAAVSLPVIVGQSAADAEEACVARAKTLPEARRAYGRTCSLPRADCDPIDGQWTCSSQQIGRSKPSSPARPRPSTTAPVIEVATTERAPDTTVPAPTSTTTSSSTPSSTAPGTSVDNSVGGNGSILLEAESAAATGNWKKTEADGQTVMLWDAKSSSLQKPQDGQSLSYRIAPDETTEYRIGLLSGRIESAIGRRDAGGHTRSGDTRNNDVWVSIVDVGSGSAVLPPTRLFTGLWKESDGELWWGNSFDRTNGAKESWLKKEGNAAAQVALEAGKVYRLDLTGRSDGYMVDRIHLRSIAHETDESTYRPAPVGSEKPPTMPRPSPGQVDYNEYPPMKEWAKAGVEGGIPTDLRVVETIKPGDDIQAAVRRAGKAGGGVVLLRKGNYAVTTPIEMESKVVLRGEDRNGVRIQSRMRKDGSVIKIHGRKQFAGVENLTVEYLAANGEKPELGWYKPSRSGVPEVNLVSIDWKSKNNWVKDTNLLNAGSEPIQVKFSDHNTLTGNYVQGAHNKGGGGQGYYRIRGSYNLVKNEVIKDVRHFGILMEESRYNVIVDSYFNTDINFHYGDGGNNLFEGNTVATPKWHKWRILTTGGPPWGHTPPGRDNLIVNNLTRERDRDGGSPFSQEDVVYTFEGYGYPVATDIEVPKGGRFYVPG